MPRHLLDAESGSASREAGSGEHEEQRHLAAAELVQVLKRSPRGRRSPAWEINECRLGEALDHGEQCIQRNGLRVCDHRSRGPNWSASPAVSCAS